MTARRRMWDDVLPRWKTAHEAAVAGGATRGQRSVLEAVLYLLAAHQKTEERLHLSQIAHHAGIADTATRSGSRTAGVHLAALAEMGAVTYEPSPGWGNPGIVGLPRSARPNRAQGSEPLRAHQPRAGAPHPKARSARPNRAQGSEQGEPPARDSENPLRAIPGPVARDSVDPLRAIQSPPSEDTEDVVRGIRGGDGASGSGSAGAPPTSGDDPCPRCDELRRDRAAHRSDLHSDDPPNPFAALQLTLAILADIGEHAEPTDNSWPVTSHALALDKLLDEPDALQLARKLLDMDPHPAYDHCDQLLGINT